MFYARYFDAQRATPRAAISDDMPAAQRHTPLIAAPPPSPPSIDRSCFMISSFLPISLIIYATTATPLMAPI